MQEAIGSGIMLERFMCNALRASNAIVSDNRGVLQIDMTETAPALRDALGNKDRFTARFELPVKDKELYLTRTHPLVESLASYVMNTTLDAQLGGIARRCGVMRTKNVSRLTTLLLIRLRYHILTRIGGQERPLLAEDCRLLAFEGIPANPTWLDNTAAEALMQSTPDTNVSPEQARHFLNGILDVFSVLQPYLDEMAIQRGNDLLDAHRRVRTSAQMKGITYRVEPQLPIDVLGMYIYLPA
jgi:hypothetical protein